MTLQEICSYFMDWHTLAAGSIALSAWWTVRTVRRKVRIQKEQMELEHRADARPGRA